MKISDLRFFSSGHFYCLLPKKFLKILDKDLRTIFLKNSLNLNSLDYTQKNYVDKLPIINTLNSY